MRTMIQTVEDEMEIKKTILCSECIDHFFGVTRANRENNLEKVMSGPLKML